MVPPRVRTAYRNKEARPMYRARWTMALYLGILAFGLHTAQAQNSPAILPKCCCDRPEPAGSPCCEKTSKGIPAPKPCPECIRTGSAPDCGKECMPPKVAKTDGSEGC